MRTRLFGAAFALLTVGCGDGCGEQVTSVAVDPTSLLMTTRGQTAMIGAQALGTQGRAIDADVAFTTSDQTIATVDDSGLVTAHKSGTARITANAGEQSATTSVEVRIPARVEVEPAKLLLVGLGATGRFSAKVLDDLGRPIPGAAVNWTVDQPRLASILDGLVTAMQVGSSNVTVSFGPVAASVQIDVSLPSFASVQVQPAKASLAVGAHQLLVASVKSASGELVAGVPIRFESSAPAIASVDAAGKIVGLAPGNATVRAIAGDKSASLQVSVRR